VQKQLIKAGEQLAAAPIPSTPVLCPCNDYCSGRCFAASCQPCEADTWNKEEDCIDAGPLGQGLLCENPLFTEIAMPCCQPNGTACSLKGGKWCDCTAYPKQAPLFPALKTRSYVNKTCVQHEANDDNDNRAYFTMDTTTVTLSMVVISVMVLIV